MTFSSAAPSTMSGNRKVVSNSMEVTAANTLMYDSAMGDMFYEKLRVLNDSCRAELTLQGYWYWRCWDGSL